MMTVHKVGPTAVVGYAEYLESAEREARRSGDYYLGQDGSPSQAAGRWHGRAATELGLTGDVTRADMLRVWEGRDPRTGDILIRRGQDGHHVAAVDCTFSAPKSVSVVWALSGPEMRTAIEAAQDRAVTVALDHIERHAPLVRRRIDGDITHEPAGGIAVARFRHHTARLSTEQHALGVPPDPQLHDHCAVANLAVRMDGAHAVNGRWAAVDSRELFRIAQEAGAVYRAELAAGLTDLGFSVVRTGRFFEIGGVPQEVRDLFSARHRELAAAVQSFTLAYGRAPSYVETRELVMLTRRAKSPEQPAAFAYWNARARAAGIDPAAIRQLHLRAPVADAVPVPASFEAAVRAVVAELTDPRSPAAMTRASAVVDERALRIAVADAAQGRVRGADVDALRAAVERSPEVVRLDGEHWTTQHMLAQERAILANATRRAEREVRPVSVGSRDAAVAQARVRLSDEQVAAVDRLCAGDELLLLTAPAGAGKGEVLRAVAAAHRADGYPVVALAAAGETAQRLGAEVDADATLTVDSFVRGGGTLRRCLIVVDEAALLETQRWYGLLRATRGCRVVAAGDPAQLSPIEAGGMWPLLEQRVPVVRLAENYRARDPWARDAWAALRDGQSVEALSAFAQRGRVILSETRGDSRHAAVEQWDGDRRLGMARGKTVTDYLLAVDGSNAEVDDLNARAQARRLAAGELRGSGLTVAAVDRRHPESLRVETLYVGDAVLFTRQVYLPRERIGRVPTGSRRVENGERGIVVGVDPQARTVTVRLGGPRAREITVAPGDHDALRLGYAQHVYNAQGRTVERVYVVTGGWQTDRESAYVGVSRARDGSFVFADYSSLDIEPGDHRAALAELADRCATSRPQRAAHSLIEQAHDDLRPEFAALYRDVPRAPRRHAGRAPQRAMTPHYDPPSIEPSMDGPSMDMW